MEFSEDPGQIEIFFMIGQRAEVGERQLVKVIDQTMQPKRLCMERADSIRGGIADSIKEGLDLTAQHGQRSPKLVKKIVNPLSARFFVLLKSEAPWR